MEIRVYNKELVFQGVVENHTSLIWTRKYFEVGTFELHAPLTAENVKLLQASNIVWMRGCVDAGVIEDIKLEESNAKNELVAKGRFLTSYLDRRIIKGTFYFSGTVENAMRELYSLDPIPLVELGETNGFAEKINFQATYKGVLSYEQKLAKGAGYGVRFRPDFKQKKIFFEIYKGVDRTTSQGVNNRVIFSENYNNLNNTIYQANTQLYKNVAYVGGQGEGAERKIVIVGDATGPERREIFVDAKDISPEGLSETEYEELLRTRGEEALAKNIITSSFECDTGIDANFKYQVNYDLGDIVTIKKNRWGIAVNKRITEIREIYENGGRTIEPTFGDALPETIDWSEN